jgi:hypothetical protein
VNLAYAPAVIGMDDGLATPLRAPSEASLGQVLWDSEGRGALAQLYDERGETRLTWLPVGAGTPVVLLEPPTYLQSFAWAEE